MFPLTCAIFSETSDLTEPCSHCVSGPSVCNCNVPGECEIFDGNFIEVISVVESVEVCQLLCYDNRECQAYTFLGEENDFRCLLTSVNQLYLSGIPASSSENVKCFLPTAQTALRVSMIATSVTLMRLRQMGLAVSFLKS